MTRRRVDKPSEPASVAALASTKPDFLFDLSESLNELGSERQWFAEGVIEGITPLVMLVGPEKSGKSWALTDLIVSTIAGGDWLGAFPVRRTGHVLLVEAEQGTHETARRIARVARGRGLKPADVIRGVRYVSRYWQLDALDADEMRALARHNKDNGTPALVAIDPLRGTMLGDENSAKDVLGALEGAAQIGRICSAPAVLAHHVNKLGAASGSRALATRPDLILTGTDTTRPRYTAVGRRIRRNDPIAEQRGFFIDVDHGEHDEDDTRATTVVKAVFGTDANELPVVRPALTQRVLEMLGRSTQPLTKRQLRDELRASNRHVTDALDALKTAGSVQEIDQRWRANS